MDGVNVNQAVIVCINLRGWDMGRSDDVSRELEEWKLDLVGVTETHLRDDV